MNQIANIQDRRALIDAGFSVLSSKDPVATLKRLEKKLGSLVLEVQALAYETTGCYAERFENVDTALCANHGWTTIKDMRQASYLQLKSDMENGVFG